MADVDLEGGAVFIVGKGHNEKERFTLPEPTAAALKAWLDARGTEPGPLFLNFDRARKGHRLTGRSVHRIVKALGARAGVSGAASRRKELRQKPRVPRLLGVLNYDMAISD